MSTLNESNLEPPPENICRIDGVAGVIFQQNGRILISDMPLSSEQVCRISDLVRKMCQGFRKVRRVLRRVIIEYPVGTLLVQSRDDSQLIVLLLEDADLDAVSEAAASFITKRVQLPLRLPSPPAAA